MRGRLPVALTSFVGRERELDEVAALVASSRLVTILGRGGVGKTRLAAEVARRLAPSYAAVLWADLAGAEGKTVLQALLEAAGRPDTLTVAALVRLLARQRALLVLDNCEAAVEACAPLAEELLRGCPGLSVLATSREPLRAAPELCWPLPPLSLPAPRVRGSATAARSEAVRLFVARAQAAHPAFHLTDANAAGVADICRRLDGIPLAIELAAPRLRAFSVEEIRRRLDQRLEVLRGGPPTARRQHRTLRAMLDWSHDLLPAGERRLLRQLAVFSGGWTLPAAEAVCGEPVAESLGALVDRSLVVTEPDHGDHRYRMLETVREYALQRLTEAGELDQLRDRHLAWCLELMNRLGPMLRGSDQQRVFGELEREHSNLLAALEWSLAAGRAEAGLRIAGELWWFWFPCGYIEQAASILSRLVESPESGRMPELRAGALEALGVILRDGGQVEAAHVAAEEAVAIRRRLGDDLKVAEALVILGWTAVFSGDFAAAEAAWSENLALSRRLGREWNAAQAEIDLGWLHAVAGDLGAARRLLEAGVATMRRLESAVYIAYGLFFSAYAAIFSGRTGDARRLLSESLQIYRELGGRRLMEPALSCLAAVAAREGAPATALRLAGATQALRDELGIAGFPGFHDRLDRELEVARLIRGGAAAADFEAGRELDFDAALEQAMAYAALGVRPARPQLSRRQAVVAALVAEGLTNHEIAASLDVADGTVKRHVEDILTRLNLQTRAQIAAWAVRRPSD